MVVDKDAVTETLRAQGDHDRALRRMVLLVQAIQFSAGLRFTTQTDSSRIIAQVPWSCGGVRRPLGKQTLSKVSWGER